MEMNDITGEVVRAAIKVHSALGPGLLESAYRTCLVHVIRSRGLRVASECPRPVVFDGVRIEVGYRIDLLVEDVVVVEVKAVQKLLPIHLAQLLSYLKLGGLPVGLLINFHVARLLHGIKRMVN
jgi:GxxExxY protein